MVRGFIVTPGKGVALGAAYRDAEELRGVAAAIKGPTCMLRTSQKTQETVVTTAMTMGAHSAATAKSR